MNWNSENLDYLTVDSIQWAKGYVRPRVLLEEKRAKHRVHQRNFVLRQRERNEELRRELRSHKLHLSLLQAAQEAAALRSEYESLRQQLVSTTLKTEPEMLPATLDVSASQPECLSKMQVLFPTGTESVPVIDDDSLIFELMTLLPDACDADATCDPKCWSPQCEDETHTLLHWSFTTSSDIATV